MNRFKSFENHICKLTQHYVKQLGCDVSVSKGATTAWLRSQWGLNNILGSGEKSREDHRHHAIDATVIALLGRRQYQQIALLAQADRDSEKQFAARRRRLKIQTPWDNLYNDLTNKVNNITVSHEANRKITGALHEETAYGLRTGENGEKVVVRRKLLDQSFTKTQVGKIFDPTVRKIVENHLNRFNGNPKKAFCDDNPVYHKDNKSRIRHLMLVESKFNPESYVGISKEDDEPYKYYPLGSNHHVEIFKVKSSGRYVGCFVSTLEAAKRARRKKVPIVNTESDEDKTFVMALHINDMVQITIGTKKEYYRVQKLDSTSNRIYLRLHTATTLQNPDEEIGKAINVLMSTHKMKKMNVNVLGRKMAND